MLKVKDFCFKYNDFILDNLQMKCNIKMFIGDLLYLYGKYYNIDSPFDFGNVIKSIIYTINSNDDKNIIEFRRVSNKSIERYKFLKSLEGVHFI